MQQCEEGVFLAMPAASAKALRQSIVASDVRRQALERTEDPRAWDR